VAVGGGAGDFFKHARRQGVFRGVKLLGVRS
jgi:hypothetical protein